MRIFVLAIVTVFLFIVSGCKEHSFSTKNNAEKVKSSVLAKVPKRIRKLKVDFDEKITLLGYTISSKEVKPGQTVTISWYWKCNQNPGPGWRLFTHTLDANGKSLFNQDAHGLIRKNYQPEHWQKGQIIKDTQKIKIPLTWKSPVAQLRIGIWREGERMNIVSGPADIENRVKGPRIAVNTSSDKIDKIPFTLIAPKIDGLFLNEEVWKDALLLDTFAHTLTGAAAKNKTKVKLMWDNKNLYVAMWTEDTYLQSKYTNHDDELWHEDAFELFLDPAGDKKDYYEIQINPAGIVFDSHLPKYRKNQNQWSSNTIVATTMKGILNDNKAEDKHWTAEMAIPFSEMTKGLKEPITNITWKVNFFRVDATKKRNKYSAWSPPLRGDFHALDRFKKIEFSQPPAPEKIEINTETAEIKK